MLASVNAICHLRKTNVGIREYHFSFVKS